MLDLKQKFAAHSLSRIPQQVHRHISVTDLPAEILDNILIILYKEAGQHTWAIIPASRVCRVFRKSAVPILFREISCSIRQTDGDRDSRSHNAATTVEALLPYVKTLNLHRALRINDQDADERASTISAERLEQFRTDDMRELQHRISCMSQLQIIRCRCSLATAVDVLTILQDRRQVAVYFDYIFSYVGQSISRRLIDNFKRLLEGRIAALGTFYIPYDLSNSDVLPGSIKFEAIPAIALEVDRVNQAELAFNSFIPGLNSQPFPLAFENLEEVWLSLNAKYLTPQISWNDLLPMIPWPRIRRLHLKGPTIQRRLTSILPHLSLLRHLHVQAQKLLTFHHNCSYARNAIYSDVNHPYFEVDFTFLPLLTSLSIEGICNHVPIQSLATPSLRSLRLHSGYARISVMAAESQRSPSDILKLAKLAPKLEKLELDIGFIENLWHSTAIPGVDVDPEIYRLLTALAQLQHLSTLRLFPPYVTRQSLAHHFSGIPDPRQPCDDDQAIRLFTYLRRQNPKLALFNVSPSSKLRNSIVGSQAMSWEVRSWGDKTLLTTRQHGKDYELRQTWEGERKITSEVKRYSYQKARGTYDDDVGEWILRHP